MNVISSLNSWNNAFDMRGEGTFILVVDDEEAVLKLLDLMLTRAGYRVLVASSGEQALETCRGIAAVDLALIDIGLPDMSGIQAAAALRSRYPEIAILYTSGWDQQRLDELKAPAGVVRKPFDEGFLDVVRAALRRGQEPAASS